MPDALATTTDLDRFGIDYKGRDIQAQAMLESVSSEVRSAAGQPITLGTYTVSIPSEASRKLDLPSRPVVSVESVKMEGEEITGWKLLGNALYGERMWHQEGETPRLMTITYTAGYKTVPQDIVRLVCAFVASGLAQDAAGGPGAHRDQAYVRADDVQIGYRQGGEEVIDALSLPETTRTMLRTRFGSPGISIGVFR